MATDAPASAAVANSGRLVGGYVWLEEHLYLVAGAWAAEEARTGVAADAVYFDTVSQHHAWCSQLLADHLPTSGVADPEGLVSSPGEVAEELLSALERLPASDRRAALSQVVHPWLEESYRRHVSLSTEESDGPLRRALGLALFDLDRDRSSGEGPATLAALRRARGAGLFPWKVA